MAFWASPLHYQKSNNVLIHFNMPLENYDCLLWFANRYSSMFNLPSFLPFSETIGFLLSPSSCPRQIGELTQPLRKVHLFPHGSLTFWRNREPFVVRSIIARHSFQRDKSTIATKDKSAWSLAGFLHIVLNTEYGEYNDISCLQYWRRCNLLILTTVWGGEREWQRQWRRCPSFHYIALRLLQEPLPRDYYLLLFKSINHFYSSTYHKECFWNAILSKEKNIYTIQTKHGDGNGSCQTRSTIEIKKCGGIG